MPKPMASQRNGAFIAGKFYETSREHSEEDRRKCINLVSRERTNAKIVLTFN